jgi:hypothetical protein
VDPGRGGERYVCVLVNGAVADMICASAEEMDKLEISCRLESRWKMFQGT